MTDSASHHEDPFLGLAEQLSDVEDAGNAHLVEQAYLERQDVLLRVGGLERLKALGFYGCSILSSGLGASYTVEASWLLTQNERFAASVVGTIGIGLLVSGQRLWESGNELSGNAASIIENHDHPHNDDVND